MYCSLSIQHVNTGHTVITRCNYIFRVKSNISRYPNTNPIFVKVLPVVQALELSGRNVRPERILFRRNRARHGIERSVNLASCCTSYLIVQVPEVENLRRDAPACTCATTWTTSLCTHQIKSLSFSRLVTAVAEPSLPQPGGHSQLADIFLSLPTRNRRVRKV
jgi:hypothetical protein